MFVSTWDKGKEGRGEGRGRREEAGKEEEGKGGRGRRHDVIYSNGSHLKIAKYYINQIKYAVLMTYR